MRWAWKYGPPVDEPRADKAILRALQEQLGLWSSSDTPPPAISRSQLQKLISLSRVTAGGSPLKNNQRLTLGLMIEIDLPPMRSLELIPEDRPLDILFEDAHIAVINKPQNLTVHPSETQTEGTLVHALLHQIQDLSGIGGVLRPGIVHRIDKNTSGALVISKSDLAHQRLSEVFSRHQIQRKYWALCFGSIEGSSQKEIRIESTIGRSPNDRKKMAMDVKDGRKSVTFIKQIECYARPGKKPFASWIEARLETGRTHQVRVHLNGLGHSILGDPVYGVPSQRQSKWAELPSDIQNIVASLPGQALHARVLGFQHPITAETLYFEAEPPQIFSNLLTALQIWR